MKIYDLYEFSKDLYNPKYYLLLYIDVGHICKITDERECHAKRFAPFSCLI